MSFLRGCSLCRVVYTPVFRCKHVIRSDLSPRKHNEQGINMEMDSDFLCGACASKKGDKLKEINNGNWLGGIAQGLSQTCPGVWLLRATGPASVHRGRIGPAAARGAD